MLFQLILAWFDRTVSHIFSRMSLCWGDQEGRHRWIYFLDGGRLIGITGKDGKIHTVVAYGSVYHYYEGKKLLKRVLVRKDLQEGERLATAEEICKYQLDMDRSSHQGGRMGC